MSKIRFTLRVDKRLLSALEQAAAADGVSVNALMTGMILELVKQHERVLTRDPA
jgi:predicted HicB family RNase H-like nuclease